MNFGVTRGAQPAQILADVAPSLTAEDGMVDVDSAPALAALAGLPEVLEPKGSEQLRIPLAR